MSLPLALCLVAVVILTTATGGAATLDPAGVEHSPPQFVGDEEFGGASDAPVTTHGLAQTNDRFEPNDDFEEATEIEEGSYGDLLIVEGESDFFAIELAAGDELTAEIFFTDEEGDLDLAVYGPGQEELADSVSVSDNESVTITAEETGTYYVEAYGFSGASNEYGLDIEVAESSSVTARCTAFPDTVTVGEEVTIDASESENAVSFEYDLDGDGDFDTDRSTEAVITHVYEEPGEYTPRVRAYFEVESDTAECGPVRVEGENEPPDATFSWDPDPAIAGESTTLDASGSSDPDGSIDEYHWDFDGDGTTDEITTDPVTTHEFAYDETGAGYAVARLTVVDDEGATGTFERDIRIRRSPTARCTVFPETVAPGEELTIDASESEHAVTYEYDLDGDGTFDTDRVTADVLTNTYDTPGEYTPRVRAFFEERSDTATCGPIRVERDNEPPVALFEYDPGGPATGESVTFNASDSMDPDGTIEEYRWDFDGDGEPETVTGDPVVTHTFDEAGSGPVRLVVVDDADATDSRERVIEVVQPGDPGESGLPGPWWLIPGAATIIGGGAGYVVGRRRCRDYFLGGGGSAPSGVTAHATGTFQTPQDSRIVAVSGLGFEPDLLVFTATNNATAAGPAVDRTDGWTYGKAKLTDEGVTQNAVSVATDARGGHAVAASRADVAIDLLIHDDDRASGLLGIVEGSTADGFEVRFDASALPDGRAEDNYVVGFQAFAVADDADAEVGFFSTPETAAVQTVGLGTDADYVQLTAVDPLGGMDAVEATDRVGVSHGVAAGDGAINQRAVGGTVAASGVGADGHAAFDDRAIHLRHGNGDEVTGRTAARVTGLGEYMELTYDEVFAGADAGGHAGPSGQPAADGGAAGAAAGGQAPGAPPRLVSFVAIDVGDGEVPDVGHFELPAPDEGPTRVDVGFEASVVEFTTGPAELGEERTVPASPLSFGWSHGLATIDRSGTVHHHVLHSSVGADRASGSGPIETPLTRTSSEPERAHEKSPRAPRSDGSGRAPGAGAMASPGAAAIALAVDDAGRIVGRDELRVTAIDRTGFEVTTERVDGAASGSEDGRRPVVFYTAWKGADH